MKANKLITLAAVVASAFLLGASEPISAVSSGVDIVSAGSAAESATTVALETRYRTTDFSNFIDMVTEKIKGLFIIVK